ncbi:MAG: DUF3784 domain-containing protein [Lachnospiraceae bacterium]
MKYLALMWIGAAMFLAAGICIMKSKKPVRLSLYTKVTPDMVADVSAYNREVGKMWCISSAVLFASGIAEALQPAFSVLIFALTCTIGVGFSVWWQSKIEEKYLVKQ